MTMINLQDELAGLKHRLDRKLDSWRRLHRDRISVTLLFGLALFLFISWFIGMASVALLGTGSCAIEKNDWLRFALVEIINLLVIMAIVNGITGSRFPKRWFLKYYRLLIKGEGLKEEIYKAYLNGNISTEEIITFNSTLKGLLMDETKFLSPPEES